jgi:DNA polymerase
MRCHIDFESRSTVDLRRSGVYRYAEDPTTAVIVVCWAVDQEPVRTWFPLKAPMPADLRAALIDNQCILVAHNAGFERTLFNKKIALTYGVPVVPLYRWDCTAARAARMALPRSLDGAAQALGLDVQKDAEGHRLMMRMCRPRSEDEDGIITWWDDDARMQRLAQYCATDVEVERLLDRKLRHLGDDRPVWSHTELINDRGVRIHTAFAQKAVEVAGMAQTALNEALYTLTGGEVGTASNVGGIKKWLSAQGINVFEGNDESLNKEAIQHLLNKEHLPENIKAVLRIRAQGGKSSVAKYTAMLDRVSFDGRVRGNLMYHGASTGRWSGSGVQLQNLPRATVKDWDAAEATLLPVGPETSGILSQMVRGTIVAEPGSRLIWADYAAIEARGVAWLAGQDDLVDLFARGGKVYEAMAASIYGVDPSEIGKDSVERFLGKTVILGCFEADTKVLTQDGWKPITYVTLTDLLWDGKEWVTHSGLVYQGKQVVQRSYGVGATADHEVLTENGWAVWQEVHTNRSLFQSALRLANLPSWTGYDLKTQSDGMRDTTRSFVVRAVKNIPFLEAIFWRGAVRDATPAPKYRVLKQISTIGGMLTSYLKKLIVRGCSTGFLRYSLDAPTLKAKFLNITVSAGFRSTMSGYATEKPSSLISLLWKGGTNQNYNWTGLIIPRGMNLGILGLSVQKLMWGTDDLFRKCRTAFQNLKRRSPVYDIAMAGPRNRFTILTTEGPIIVHNCGYSMGAVRFRQACAAMGVHISEELAERAVRTYRTLYPQIPLLWRRLEDAAVAAVRRPCNDTTYGRVMFRSEGDWLMVRLPSGRKLFYREPRVVEVAGPFGSKPALAYMAVSSFTRKWQQERTFGGKLTENIVQGICRDLIASAMLALEPRGYPVIASVHDEVICEVPLGTGSQEEMVEIMCQVPDWAKGFPVAAEAKEGIRYGK